MLHMLTVPSHADAANVLPSGPKQTSATRSGDPRRTCSDLPVETFHNRIVMSCDAEAIILPSGLKLTLVTARLCESSDRACPEATSQRRTELSVAADASSAPSGLKRTQLTSRVCPLSVRDSPVVTSHRRIVLSRDPLASVFPSALKLTLLTAPVWPVRT